MSYFQPYIDETGLHRPMYSELLEAMVDDAYRIFGTGIYLGHDSQDYQFIATLAEKIFDTHQLLEAVYQSRSPATAIGAGLDAIVAVNGIQRKTATRSTAILKLTGTPGARIENGVVADDDGHLWDLKEPVVLSDDGEAEALAICREYGLIYVPSGGITKIMTPMIHWISVTNESPASVGSVTESDASLRARRMLSVAQPSRSIIDGLRGGIAAVPDVERSVVFENDTNLTSPLGLPPHSVCAVAEGGAEADIARVLYLKKAPGCYTHGDVEVDYVDEYGNPHTLRFMRPHYVDIRVSMRIKKRDGFKEDTPGAIRGRIAGYIGEMDIGGSLPASILWLVAQDEQGTLHAPTFSIEDLKIGRDSGPLGTGEITLSFCEAARVNVNDIVIETE